MVPRGSLIEGLDVEVARAFEASLGRLAAAGALITHLPVPAFERQAEYFRSGGFAGAEAFAIHRRWMDRITEYDPRVGKRINLAKDLSAADYVDLLRLRQAYIAEVGAALAPFDAFLMPTTPCIAPTIKEVDASDDDYFRWNMRILRNVGVVNFLDGCAVTLPCHPAGSAPVGLSVCGPAMSDRHILAVARAVEGELATGR
jgi:aspartyl-tRNA(Asn)/glutamyl-tRNA(Gln) amidotransferase subunit A